MRQLFRAGGIAEAAPGDMLDQLGEEYRPTAVNHPITGHNIDFLTGTKATQTRT